MTIFRLIRLAAMIVILALLFTNLVFAAKKPADPAAMKGKVEKHGAGRGVRVTLADNTEVKGLIVSIDEQSFALKSPDTDQPREIQFAEVIGVHKDRSRTGRKVGIGTAIIGTVVIITAVVIDGMFRI